MSYEANMDALWKNAKTAKNGIPYVRYDDLPEGSYIKSQLRQEDGSSVTIDGFRYVLSIYNGRALVFRNPTKSNNDINIKPTSPQDRDRSQSDNDRQGQQQVVLSLQIVEWIRQNAIDSRQTLEVVKWIKEFLAGVPVPSEQEERQNQS